MLNEQPRFVARTGTTLVQIPELLRIILLELRIAWRLKHDRTIFSYTIVDQFWHSISIRLLWELCGEGFGFKNTIPKVRHLVAIEKSRRQRYANVIRITSFNNERRPPPDRWEGRFHTELAELSFLMLMELDITIFDREPCRPIPTLHPYVQSHLQNLFIMNFGGSKNLTISNEFFLTLLDNPDSLQQLSLKVGDDCVTVSPEIVSRFFQDTQTLTNIDLGSEFAECMSLEGFLNLSRLLSLRELSIYSIPGDWVEKLEIESFIALRSLDCRTDSIGLDRLLKIQPSFSDLTIREPYGSTDMIHIVAEAQLKQLQRLRVLFCWGIRFRIRDLLSIAENAGNLRTLILPTHDMKDTEPNTIIEGLDDLNLLEWQIDFRT